jgi:hypothetical protein
MLLLASGAIKQTQKAVTRRGGVYSQLAAAVNAYTHQHTDTPYVTAALPS